MSLSVMENLKNVKMVDKEVYEAIAKELKRQQEGVELIASENYPSKAVLEAASSVLTNKYAEGYPYVRDKETGEIDFSKSGRYYGGCDNVNTVERLAIERAKKLFGAEHVNVQPHSGSQANFAVFMAVLAPGDPVLGMSLDAGGHLTHGYKVNFSGKIYTSHNYGVNPGTGLIDYAEIRRKARDIKPKLLITGYSAYPRLLDWKMLKSIADEVGAVLLADIAHIAGMIAAKQISSPIPYADIVTTTTHKTLRGPRSGLIMCKKEWAKKIDSAVFPGSQGGPLEHIIAAKAVAFKEALHPSFVAYQKQVLKNAKAMAARMQKNGFALVTGGTDNHLMLVDLRPKSITGKDAEDMLGRADITVNKNTIPADPEKPFVTSGVRIGTPAMTSRGMKEKEFEYIADLITQVIDTKNNAVIDGVRQKVHELCARFPLYE